MRGKLVGDEPRLKGHYGGELGWSAVPDIALSNALIGQDMPANSKRASWRAFREMAAQPYPQTGAIGDGLVKRVFALPH
jgi:hypothetical protein